MEEKLLEALNKINHRLDKMDGRLDEMSEKMIGIEGRVAQEIRQQILDHMFVFETEYGRKINIAFEEITAKNHRELIQDETIKNLERRTDMNSAFVHSHEERITVLEKTQI